MSIGNFDTQRISKQTTIMLCVIIGITAALIIYSALCPPPGKIDESMNKLLPWAFGFCSLLVAREAIKEGFGLRYKNGDVTIEVDGNKDDAQ